VADVNELRLVKFKDKVKEAVLSGAGKEFQPLLEQIESEGDIPAIEIAAALASLMQGTTPLLLAQKEDLTPKGPPAIDGSVPMSTYRIAVGHAHGVLPGNIVGAIANEAGIDGKRIGHIDIREDHSYVDLPTLPEDMVGTLQAVRVRGEPIKITRVDSKPDKPKFSGQSRRPDRMAEQSRERPVYRGGGNRFEREGGKRPYKGSPKFADETQRFEGYASNNDPSGERPAAPAGDAGERPRFERRDRPSFSDKPSGFKKTFKKEGFKPGGFKKDGFKKDGFKPAGTGFKKKFTGKAAGAKGSYKGGKAFRDKSK
jgi:hypothetical protein